MPDKPEIDLQENIQKKIAEYKDEIENVISLPGVHNKVAALKAAKDFNKHVNIVLMTLRGDERLACKAKGHTADLFFIVKTGGCNQFNVGETEGLYENGIVVNDSGSVGIIWSISGNLVRIKPVDVDFIAKKDETVALLLDTEHEFVFIKMVLTSKDDIINAMKSIGKPHLFDHQKVNECEASLEERDLGKKERDIFDETLHDKRWIWIHEAHDENKYLSADKNETMLAMMNSNITGWRRPFSGKKTIEEGRKNFENEFRRGNYENIFVAIRKKDVNKIYKFAIFINGKDQSFQKEIDNAILFIETNRKNSKRIKGKSSKYPRKKESA